MSEISKAYEPQAVEEKWYAWWLKQNCFTANPHSGLSPAASLIAIAGFVLGALAAGRAAHSLSSRPGPWLATAFTTEAVILTLLITAVVVATMALVALCVLLIVGIA